MRTIILILTMGLIMSELSAKELMPPKAKKILKTTKIHSYELKDNYFWLREKEKPEVINYLKAENDYANNFMSDTKETQTKLYDEILSRIKQTDLSVPVKIDNYYYYSRTEEGKNYSIMCRKEGSLNSSEEIILDENALAEGKSYFDLGFTAISPNHKLLAYSIDTVGNENYTIYIKNLESGELLKDKIEKASTGFEWALDNETFFYTTLNDVNQANKVWRHKLNSNKSDELVYEEKDNEYFLDLDRTKDRTTITINLASKDESEIWVIDANNPSQEPKLIKKRSPQFEYYIESWNDDYFIVTNDKAINFKVMRVAKSNPSYENWFEFIPYNEKVKISSVEPFENYLVIHQRKNGLTAMDVFIFSKGKQYSVKFPEKVYSYHPYANPDFKSDRIRISYTSMITPNSVYDYDLATRKFDLLKETEVLGGYDKNKYESIQIFAKAKDGKDIPISLVYKKGLQLDGNNPTILYAYGSYGYAMDPYFSSVRLSYLDRGFVYAIAHIRGGGEYGDIWYRDGKMLNKMNTFTDFISCAEKLIEDKYTNNNKLVIQGGSAGGLLVGAVTNMRPDLFKLVIAEVPFVDVMNTMMDPTIPLTVAEYKEWGNPNDKQYFDYMMSYSPYDNIQAKNYPNMLVRAGLNDPRVSYWEPAKYVAKLRDMKKDNNTILFVTNMDSGHGGSSGRYDRYKEVAFDMAYIFKILGIKAY